MRFTIISFNVTIEAARPVETGFNWSILLPALVAAIIVAIGWRVVEGYARRREMRADLRSAMSNFTETVAEVGDSAVAFYGLPGNSPQATALAGTIRAKIDTLSRMLEVFSDAGIPIDTVEQLKRFRQAVTGGEFESLARQPLPPVSPIIQRIAADGQGLVREVQIEMMKYLVPRNRWQKRWRGKVPAAAAER